MLHIDEVEVSPDKQTATLGLNELHSVRVQLTPMFTNSQQSNEGKMIQFSEADLEKETKSAIWRRITSTLCTWVQDLKRGKLIVQSNNSTHFFVRLTPLLKKEAPIIPIKCCHRSIISILGQLSQN